MARQKSARLNPITNLLWEKLYANRLITAIAAGIEGDTVFKSNSNVFKFNSDTRGPLCAEYRHFTDQRSFKWWAQCRGDLDNAEEVPRRRTMARRHDNVTVECRTAIPARRAASTAISPIIPIIRTLSSFSLRNGKSLRKLGCLNLLDIT